jgi:hypothetical protein
LTAGVDDQTQPTSRLGGQTIRECLLANTWPPRRDVAGGSILPQNYQRE